MIKLDIENLNWPMMLFSIAREIENIFCYVGALLN